ncbi:hypothetical protein [Streptomyces sp. NPDC054804]
MNLGARRRSSRSDGGTGLELRMPKLTEEVGEVTQADGPAPRRADQTP